jgi:predicted cation transporter
MSLFVIIPLTIIILLALFLPFTVHAVEKELEIFLFILGVLAVSISGVWSLGLITNALKEPVAISLAVLLTGLMFRYFRKHINKFVELLEIKIGLKPAIFCIIFVLSLLSSVITAIVAALVLCEIAATLKLSRRDTIHVIVMGCFAIGMGAVLTPLGEPLSTIVTSKLSGPPHNAGFGYLFGLLWKFILPGAALFAFLASRVKEAKNKTAAHLEREDINDILMRAAKVFLFVAALVLFGQGLVPLAKISIMKLQPWALYWANIMSAILDNATLAAVEILPDMTNKHIEFLLMALVVSGGFLIPGNIPNIICASKFKIKSKEWAKAALPAGIAVMFVYFVILSIMPVSKI